MFPAIIIDTEESNKITTNTSELAVFKEVNIDLETGKPIIQDGQFQIVERNDALVIWAWKALNTKRYNYIGYSWNYGQEFENLIGNGLSSSETKSAIKKYIEDCLFVNPYIKKIDNLIIELDGAKLITSFTMTTIYGEVTYSV